jgi:hypothetical protein
MDSIPCCTAQGYLSNQQIHINPSTIFDTLGNTNSLHQIHPHNSEGSKIHPPNSEGSRINHSVLEGHVQGNDSKTTKIWDLGKTPVRVPALKKYLDQYPRREVANKLFQGFTKGFKLHYLGPRLPIHSENLISAYEHHLEVKDKLSKEIDLGRISGPYKEIPISNLRVYHPLG